MWIKFLIKSFFITILETLTVVGNGQAQVVESTECSKAAGSYGAQVVQMCHRSSATGTVFLALDASAAKSVLSSHPVTECACALSVSGGSVVAMTALTGIAPTTDCGTKIAVTLDQSEDSKYLECSSDGISSIYGSRMSIFLRKVGVTPEAEYNFDYCLAVYIKNPEPNSKISISCLSPVDLSSAQTSVPTTIHTTSDTQCSKAIHSSLWPSVNMAQMCHGSTATGNNFVILDMMAAESVMSQEVNKCTCAITIQGGNEFRIAQATHIGPSAGCGTYIEIRTAGTTSEMYQIECQSTSPRVKGNAAEIVLSKSSASEENEYDYNYCLSVYISNKIEPSSYLTLTCFAPQETSMTSTLSIPADTRTISPLVSRSMPETSLRTDSLSTTYSVSSLKSSHDSVSTTSVFSTTTAPPRSSTIKNRNKTTLLSDSTRLSTPTTSSAAAAAATSTPLLSSSLPPPSLSTSSVKTATSSSSSSTSTTPSLSSSLPPPLLSTSSLQTAASSSSPTTITSSSSSSSMQSPSLSSSSSSTTTTTSAATTSLSFLSSTLVRPSSSSLLTLPSSITTKERIATTTATSTKTTKSPTISLRTESTPARISIFTSSSVMSETLPKSTYSSLLTPLDSPSSTTMIKPLTVSFKMESSPTTQINLTTVKPVSSTSHIPSSPLSRFQTSAKLSTALSTSSSLETPRTSSFASTKSTWSGIAQQSTPSSVVQVTTRTVQSISATTTTASATLTAQGTKSLTISAILTSLRATKTTPKKDSSSTQQTSTADNSATTAESTEKFPLEVVISVPAAVIVIIGFGACICLTSRKSYINTNTDTSTKDSIASLSGSVRTSIEDKVQTFLTANPEFKSLNVFSGQNISVDDLYVKSRSGIRETATEVTAEISIENSQDVMNHRLEVIPE